MPKQALGRGLSVLLNNRNADRDSPVDTTSASAPVSESDKDRIRTVSIDKLVQSKFQPRKVFSEGALKELADSIREQGILQPLIVRHTENNQLELIAGERRWRAATLAGLVEVPVIIRDADDPTVLELMLIENLQREDLNPIEEALGYSRLIDEFQLRQEDVALKVGKSRAVVANALRLLKLPESIRNWVRDGNLSVGNAKVILSLSTEEEQILAARKVLEQHLSVRETEQLVLNLQKRSNTAWEGKAKSREKGKGSGRGHTGDLQERLTQHFGTRVNLKYSGGKGSVEIRFYNDDDLDRVLEICGFKLD